MFKRISTYSSTFRQHFESSAVALEGWNGLDHVQPASKGMLPLLATGP